jgi:lysophospholipase L1-like esterase
VAARILGRSVTNLGYSGACLLDPLVARVIAEQPTEHIALEIGINIHNTAALRSRTLLPVLHGFLATIRSRRAHVPITVIGPVFGGAREESVVACGQEEVWEVSGDLTLGEIRGLLREAVRLLRKRGDTALTWIDGRQLFGAADAAAGGLPDGLHPDAAGQLRMGERFAVLQSGFGAGANSGQWAPRQSSESVRNQSGSRKGH